MKLLNLTDMPPRGYLYYEPALNWRTPPALATEGLRNVAEALQQARINNPQAGLDPSYEACVRDIGVYTCERLKPWPKVQKHFCGGPAMTAQERAELEAREKASEKRGCATCGRRR